jgi:hypothetical protein
MKKVYKYWIFGSLCFILIMALLTFALLQWLKPTKESQPNTDEPYSSQIPKENNAVKIKEPSGDGVIGQKIYYKSGSFTPAVIHMKDNAENDGCLLTLVNEGENDLKIGLSPHNENGDPGSDYPPVPPGGKLIFDPRYRVTEIKFHDHKNPSSGFEVILDGKCSLK